MTSAEPLLRAFAGVWGAEPGQPATFADDQQPFVFDPKRDLALVSESDAALRAIRALLDAHGLTAEPFRVTNVTAGYRRVILRFGTQEEAVIARMFADGQVIADWLAGGGR